ncbi:MAG: Rab family GTPase [Burkholderiales bacterium]
MCMLGAFGVGKTSLVRRYVDSIFADTYLTTVGVKMDKKTVDLDGRDVTLILWDIAGEDDISAVRMSYVRGATGALLVADGTRDQTLAVARSIGDRVRTEIGDIPLLLLINKLDLRTEWTVTDAALSLLRAAGWNVVATSAKTGEGVEQAFVELARRIMT